MVFFFFFLGCRYPFFPVYCIFPLSQATFAHDLLSSVLISFTAALCLSLPFVNRFPPVPTYSDSFCLSYFVCPFLLNLSPSRDACPIFPNVPSSSLTLLHFPALSGQRACPQTKCFSSHLLGKPHRDSDSTSGVRRGCCATKPWVCLHKYRAAFTCKSQDCVPSGQEYRYYTCSYTI